MDTETIDQEYAKLQTEFQDVAKTVAALASKLQAAEKAGDTNAGVWLADLEEIAQDIDDEQAQAGVLLLAIHNFIGSVAQSGQAAPAGSDEHPPLFAPGHGPSEEEPEQAPQHHGILSEMMGGGMLGGGMLGGGMMGGYYGGGFARSMEMGMGMSLGASLIGSIFR